MFTENRLIYDKRTEKAHESLHAGPANNEQSTVKAQEEAKAKLGKLQGDLEKDQLGKEKDLDSRIDPKAVLSNLPDKGVVRDFVDDLNEHPDLVLDNEVLLPFAEAVYATNLRQDTEGKLRNDLQEYITAVRNGANLSANGEKTKSWLQENLRGLASYNARYEAVRGDTRGNISSMIDDIKEQGIDGIKKFFDFYADRSSPEKLGIVAAAVVAGLWLFNSDSPTANTLRSAVIGLGVTGLAGYGINKGVELVTDKSLVGHIDDWNATADVDSLSAYFNITGDKKDEVAQTLSDAANFNSKTRSMSTKEILEKYRNANKKGTAGKMLKLDEEKLDPSNLYLAIEAFAKKLDTLNPDLKAKLQKKIDSGAEFMEVYITLLQLDRDAWHIESYHTQVAGRFLSWMEDHISGDFEDDVDVDTNFRSYESWLKTTKMHPKGSSNKVTPEWLTARFGAEFNRRSDLEKTGYAATINEALASNKELKFNEASYLAVNVKVNDNDTPLDYLKKAQTALDAKYGLGGKSGFGLEPVLGTLINQPEREYILLVRKVDANNYSPVK